MDNQWPLKYVVRILGLPKILLGKADLMLLIKAQKIRKKINLHKLVVMDVTLGTPIF